MNTKLWSKYSTNTSSFEIYSIISVLLYKRPHSMNDNMQRVLCMHVHSFIVANLILIVILSVSVKPPKKGHIGDGPSSPSREVVLFSEVFF